MTPTLPAEAAQPIAAAGRAPDGARSPACAPSPASASPAPAVSCAPAAAAAPAQGAPPEGAPADHAPSPDDAPHAPAAAHPPAGEAGERVEAVHEWLSALADPTRTRLLMVLARHELAVGELCETLQLPQSTISRHLRVLAREGWVGTRAEGTSRYYRLARLAPLAQRLWEAVRSELETLPESAEDEARAVQSIELRRTGLERAFAPDTSAWDADRARLYGLGVELRALPALLEPSWVVADLGCGTGIVAHAVAPHVARVIGVDASPYQLKEAARRLRDFRNVELRQARLETLPLESESVDVALIFLVLHYLPEPRRALVEAGRVLRRGGRLLVLDLAPHGREEYRLQLHHVWQGFPREQLAEWLAEAGLGDVRYHELPPEKQAEGPALFTAAARKA